MTGADLTAWRKASPYKTQAEAAALMGVSLRTYARWEALPGEVPALVLLATQAVTNTVTLELTVRALDEAVRLVRVLSRH